MNFVDSNARELEALARMSAAAGARADYVQGGGGNTSVKLPCGLMAIKASGYRLGQVSARGGYAVLDLSVLDGFFGRSDPDALDDVEAAGTAALRAAARPQAGLPALRPSVESGFHSLLDRYVLHTHSIWANMAMCAQGGADEVCRALSGSGLSWCCVGYVNPGAALTFALRAALDQHMRSHGRMPELIFLGNHGMVASAQTADEALSIHERANALLAAHFGHDMRAYCPAPLTECGEGRYASGLTVEPKRALAELLYEALYPDQLVLLSGNVALCAPGQAPCHPINIHPDGHIEYLCAREPAEAYDQTICAITTIRSALRARGLRAVTMTASAQGFISSWEAEAARRRQMGV